MKKFILSAFADEYDANFEEQLRGLKRFDIEHIEIRGVDGKNVSVLNKSEVHEVKSKLDAYGITASAIGSPIGKVALDADLDAHLEMSKRVFETACELGTQRIRMFSFYPPKGENIVDCKEKVFHELDRLNTLAKQHGVMLCHENEAEIYGSVPERCREISDAFGGDIRTVFDMGNYVLEGVEPYKGAYGQLRDSIEYFHIKDALFEGAIVPPGKGEARIGEILKEHLAYSSGDVVISVEPHLQLFSGLNQLVSRKFENPYKFNNEKEAFAEAVLRLKELIV